MAGADDAAVVAGIEEAARAEAAAAVRRLSAIAELVSRHADGPTHHAHWSCDNWDAIAAEVAAAQNISHTMASGQMYLAVALRDRLPKVAALFAEGTISTRLATAIVWHTDLITDPDTMRLVDTTLADEARRFGPLSVAKSAIAIDAIVDRHDSEAVRRTRAGARERAVVIGPDDDGSGATLPAPLLAELIAGGAAVKPVRHPGDSPPEPGYRPSAQLQRFIRCRDLTCRFPSCDRPAELCDVDHTVPYPLGLTHPSNLKCLCRKHHLLKTFWSGPDRWRDRQHPDGAIT